MGIVFDGAYRSTSSEQEEIIMLKMTSDTNPLNVLKQMPLNFSTKVK
jgi:hypothetical protein